MSSEPPGCRGQVVDIAGVLRHQHTPESPPAAFVCAGLKSLVQNGIERSKNSRPFVVLCPHLMFGVGGPTLAGVMADAPCGKGGQNLARTCSFSAINLASSNCLRQTGQRVSAAYLNGARKLHARQRSTKKFEDEIPAAAEWYRSGTEYAGCGFSGAVRAGECAAKNTPDSSEAGRMPMYCSDQRLAPSIPAAPVGAAILLWSVGGKFHDRVVVAVSLIVFGQFFEGATSRGGV